MTGDLDSILAGVAVRRAEHSQHNIIEPFSVIRNITVCACITAHFRDFDIADRLKDRGCGFNRIVSGDADHCDSADCIRRRNCSNRIHINLIERRAALLPPLWFRYQFCRKHRRSVHLPASGACNLFQSWWTDRACADHHRSDGGLCGRRDHCVCRLYRLCDRSG